MKKMLVKFDDSYVEFVLFKFGIFSKSRSFFFVDGKIIDNKLVVIEILGDSLVQVDDIKIGDVIIKINDKIIVEYIVDNKGLIVVLNMVYYNNKLVEIFLLLNLDIVNVEFLKDGKYVIKVMKWFDYYDFYRNEFKKGVQKKKEKYKILDYNIGYVDMGILKDRNVFDMIEKLKFI